MKHPIRRFSIGRLALKSNQACSHHCIPDSTADDSCAVGHQGINARNGRSSAYPRTNSVALRSSAMQKHPFRLNILRRTLVLFAWIMVCKTAPCADALVSSSESHSIEWFADNGAWISTFASTGARIPVGLAQSPIDENVYVATYTNTILRYGSNGQPFSGGWDTFTLPESAAGNVVESLMFDSAGDLYVATYYGTSGYTQVIYRYHAAALTAPNPSPFDTITTTLKRGDQMAFDGAGNLCIASWADEDVICIDTATHTVVFDYKTEILASVPLFSPVIEPVGLAFQAPAPSAPLILSSTFAGQVAKEKLAHVGPFSLLASGLTPQVMHLTRSGSDLYLPSYNVTGRFSSCSYYACNDFDFKPDTVYKIDLSSGAVTSFITSHVWGPYELIFAKVTKCKPCPTSSPCLMPV
jgi:hypothetical protein